MNKKLIIVPALLLALALAGFFMLSVLINKDTVKTALADSFKSLTGMTLEIQGNAEVQVFPSPHVLIGSVLVHNVPGAASSFLLSVRNLDVHISLLPLLGGKLEISDLTASGVDVELEHMQDGQYNWKLASAASAAPQSSGALLDIPSLTVADAVVRYTDSMAGGPAAEYKNISLTLRSGGSLTMRLSYKNKPLAISGSVGSLSQAIATGVMPVSLSVKSGNSEFTYEGDGGFKDNNYYFKGTASIATDDAAPWIMLALNKALPPADKPPSYTPLPLQAKTSITSAGGAITFGDIALSGATVKGAMQATLTLPLHLDIKATIDSLDLESVFASSLPAATTAPSDAPAADGTSIVAPKSLLDTLTLSADVTLADMLYNNQHIRDTHVTMDMTGGEMSIPQASAVLPGESRVVFSGLGKEAYLGFTLEGQVDARGSDFAQMLGVFKPKGFSIPADDFKRFALKTNAAASLHEIRLSEMAARIENIAFVGGIVATLGDRPKIQAALHLGGIDMDHFAALWGLQAWRTSFLSDDLAPKSESFLSQWLKHLGFDLSVNAVLEKCIINGKVRGDIALSLEAMAGKISVSNLKTSYNGSELAGDVSIDVTQPLPRLSIDMAADTFDMDTFFPPDAKPAAPAANAQRWSSSDFDLHWLELFNAGYHLRFGHFSDAALVAQNVDLKGTLEDSVLNIDSLTATTLGAAVASRIQIKGGKIPTVQLAAKVDDLDATELTPYLPVLQGMTGKYNFSLQLASNGNTWISWVSNLSGAVGVGGRNILVRGFNLPGIVSAIAYVRTVADILNVVQRAFPGGDTLFTTVTGQWTITNGIINLSNTKLDNPQAGGVLDGKVDLIKWQTQNLATFALTSLDAANPPSITINFSGGLDAPEKSIDTRLLEHYVTNKTSQNMLQQYGH